MTSKQARPGIGSRLAAILVAISFLVVTLQPTVASAFYRGGSSSAYQTAESAFTRTASPTRPGFFIRRIVFVVVLFLFSIRNHRSFSVFYSPPRSFHPGYRRAELQPMSVDMRAFA